MELTLPPKSRSFGGVGSFCTGVIALGMVLVSGCARAEPEMWSGPVLTQPRIALTRDDLTSGQASSLVDMSFFSRPEWAGPARTEFSGRILVSETEMTFPLSRPHHPGENLFPAFAIDFVSHDGELLPGVRKRIDTTHNGTSGWDVFIGAGRVWQEEEDQGWSRGSFPINLTDRLVGSVRNCVGTFLYTETDITNLYVQCSQETADIQDNQIGDIRVSVSAEYQPQALSSAQDIIIGHAQRRAALIPVRPLAEIDTFGEISDYFSKARVTSAPTSTGAVYLGDTLYSHPPQTRHGVYPYPDEMRHGVYSVSKSLTGALAMFYFAERYSDGIFEAQIAEYVPPLSDHPEWQGVTFGNALDMATGTRGGGALDLLFYPLMMANNKDDAIENIASLGDDRPLPGRKFNYATTNFFVLSYALQNYVEEREGPGMSYWDLVQTDVLDPIGAGSIDIMRTRDTHSGDRLPVLGYGTRPTLDEAAKIARLIANEGEHDGRQLLNRASIRRALGRTEWRGYKTQNRPDRYRHSFWARRFRPSTCRAEVPYMEGFGTNHIFVLPSGTIVLRFMDEFDWDLKSIVHAVDRIDPLCE